MTRSTPPTLRRLIFTFAALSAAIAPFRAAAASVPSGGPATADLLPDDALVAVTLRDGRRLLADFRNSDIVKSWLAGSAYQTLSANPEFSKAQAGLLLFAASTGMDAWTAVGQALGKDVTLAVVPAGNDEKPALVAVMQSAETDATTRLLDILLNMTGATAGGEPVQAKSKLVDGVRGYLLNKDACIAAFDDFIAFSNRPACLERLIERRGSPDTKLSRDARYAKAAGDVPKDAVAWAFFDIRRIREKAGEGFNKKLDNALGALLFGGVVDAVRSADAAAMWLEADPKGLTVSGRLYGADAGRRQIKPFVVAAGEERDWSKLDVPGLIGGFELARDWAGFWDLREELIDAEGIRGLTEFASTLTTLMGRLDFSSELLPELKPTLRFLAARQEFKDGAPTPELPGFALLLQMKDAAKLADRLEQGSLMALSIINVDMGQKMQPQFRVGLEEHAGAKLIVAQYPEKLDPGVRGIRYNFAPAIATVGDRFVIATSKKLLTDIIDAAKRLDAPGQAAPAPGQTAPAPGQTAPAPGQTAPAPSAPRRGQEGADVLRLDLRALREVFDANREVFITNRMLEDDVPREKAAAQVGMFLDAAKYLSDFSLELRPGKDGYALKARLGLCAK